MSQSSNPSAEARVRPVVRVLYVKDDPALGAGVQRRLQRAGVEVTTAHNREETLQLARQGIFDLILLDVLLSSGSGFDLCRLLKADPLLKPVPVIFFSGAPTAQGREEALRLGAVAYLSKGSRKAELGRRILTAAGLHGAAASSMRNGSGPRPA